jgi:hypothetical protein
MVRQHSVLGNGSEVVYCKRSTLGRVGLWHVQGGGSHKEEWGNVLCWEHLGGGDTLSYWRQPWESIRES